FDRPISWMVFVLLAIAAIFYIYKNFDKANSLVNVDIQMNRDAALNKVARLASEFETGPEDFKQAAAFRNDSRFQNFVELEDGGLDTFTHIISKGYYYSYHWTVRHFKEQEANEVVFWFKPNGDTYGFSEKIPETEKGAALDADEALRIAEHNAIYNWEVDLEPYKLVEKSKEKQISGRIAFLNHIQWWKIWTKQSGGSLTVLGQVAGGYLFAIISEFTGLHGAGNHKNG
ncbi:MAG: hypothetical protein J7L95_05125, partial [Prolixibacteraceae bacterium]|nr:hypothetical protein [Prolixibacteraceae bacterium]